MIRLYSWLIWIKCICSVTIVFAISACSTDVSLHPNAHYSPDMTIAIVDVEHTTFKLEKFYLVVGIARLPCNVAPKLEGKIIKQGFFNVADRSQIATILEEQKLQNSDMMDPATAVEVGKLAGLDAIMTVKSVGVGMDSILYCSDSFECNARLIDCKTGHVIGSLSSRRVCPSIFLGWWPLADNNNWLASKIATELENQLAEKAASNVEINPGE